MVSRNPFCGLPGLRYLYQKVLDSHLGSGKESRAASEAGVTLGKVPATLEPQFPSMCTCLLAPHPMEQLPLLKAWQS